MKIKISKSQWEEMGKKAGWAREMEQKRKTASKYLPPNVEYYEDPGDHGKVPKIPGYYLIKEYQRWGYCPTYRNETNKEDVIYLDRNSNKLYNWEEMKQVLRDIWRPAAREDQDWFVANLSK